MYKGITCWIWILTGFYSFAQNDSIVVEEYDTIVIVKEPLVIEQKIYVLKEQREKKYSLLLYSNVGLIFNYINTCDCYSRNSIKNAIKAESYFSFNAAITKKIKKRFGIELGLSTDYMKQSYLVNDTSLTKPITFKNNSLYLGTLSHIKYYIISPDKVFNLAAYVGVKGLFVLNQTGNVYNVAEPAVPEKMHDMTKSFVYGLSGRLEANIQTRTYAKVVFGLNYYYDLTSYTLADLNYYLQRNIPGIFVGYRIQL